MAKKIKPVGTTNFTGMSGQLWKAEIFLGNDRRFYIPVPEQISIFTGVTKVYSIGYDEVISAANKEWQKYLLATVQEVKTIRYFYARQVHGDHIINRGFHPDRMIRHGLGIGYEIGYKMKLGNCYYWHHRTYAEFEKAPMNQRLEQIELNHDAFQKLKNWQYVDWTPELQTFFEETTKSLISLISKVDAFFGENPDTLVGNVNSQKKLLQ